MDRQIDGQMDGWMEGSIWIDGQVDRQVDRLVRRQVDREVDKLAVQTNQTDKHVERWRYRSRFRQMQNDLDSDILLPFYPKRSFKILQVKRTASSNRLDSRVKHSPHPSTELPRNFSSCSCCCCTLPASSCTAKCMGQHARKDRTSTNKNYRFHQQNGSVLGGHDIHIMETYHVESIN